MKIAEVVTVCQTAPFVERKASLTDLRTALSKNDSRFVLVTETGASIQKILGIVNLMKLLS